MNRETNDVSLTIVATLLGLFMFFASISIAASQVTLGLTLIAAAIVVVTRRINPLAGIPRSVLIVIAAWVLWQGVSSLANANSLASLVSLRSNWLFLILPVAMMVWRKHANLLIGCLAAGMIFVGLVGIWQYLFGSTPLRPMVLAEAPGFGYRATGFFSGLITYGDTLALATAGLLGLMAAGYNKLGKIVTLLAWVALPIGTLAVLFNFGRASIGGLLIAVLGVLVFAKRSKRWLIVAIPTFLIMAAALIPGVTDRFRDQWYKDWGGVFEGGRVFIWKQTLPLIKENPLFGVGPVNFREEYTKGLRPDVSQLHKHSSAHNDFLNIAATTGLPGLVIYLMLWTLMMRLLLQAALRMSSGQNENFAPVVAALAASVGFLVLSLFHDPFFDEEVRQVLIFFWAVGICSAYKASTERGAVRHPQTP